MRLGDNEWPQDILNIVSKNNKRNLKAIFPLTGYIIFSILALNSYWIWGVILLLVSFIPLFFIPKKIEIPISDMLAVNLYYLFINIEKFDKNPHYKEEAKKYLLDLDSVIKDYLFEKNKTDIIDFNHVKNIEHLKKLKKSVRKVFCYLEEYNNYKEKKEELRSIIQRLAFSFHKNEDFSEESKELINKLELLEIPEKPLRVDLKLLLKEYLIEKRLIYWGLLVIYLIVVWFLPSFTTLELSVENRLMIILPVVPLVIILFMTPNQKNKSKKSSA